MKDKIILITGAGSGIGKALCLSLHHENQLIVIGRDQKKLNEIKSTDNERIDTYICDIAEEEQVNLTYQKIASKYGHINILINNAGISDARPFTDYEYSKMKKILDINVLGTIYFTKVFLPLVLKKGGTVANVGSMFGDIAHPLYSIYSASKFAIKGFSDALRREYMHQGLKVAYIAPRATQTDALNATKNYGKYFEMNIDHPVVVAENIIDGLKKQKNYIYPKSIERLFVFVQKMFPKAIDQNLNAKIKNL